MDRNENAKTRRFALNMLKAGVAISGAALLFACGDDSSSGADGSQTATGVDSTVESVDDLINCTPKHEGEMAYIKEEKATYVCVDGDWITASISESVDDLINCTSKHEGETVFVKEDKEIYVCTDGDWVVAGETGDGDDDDGDDADKKSSSSKAKSADSKGKSSSSFKYEQDSSAYEQPDVVKVKDKSIAGVSQKGPFVTGSAVKLYELDGETYAQTGKSFTGKITSDNGEFGVSSVTLASQYALLEASGYYRNEVNGKKSGGTITLNALTDLSDREKVNINLLTHLEYERALYLVGTGVNVPAAKKQAEAEIFNAFGIQGDFANSEDLNIFSKGEGNAALLAFSILMQGNRSEAELTELLTKFATDIEKDGEWNDESTKAKIADWANEKDLNGGLSSIRSNINSWGLGSAPDFEKYVRNFWYASYGLESCEADNQGEVAAATNEHVKTYGSKTRYICKDGVWAEASDIEKDTYQWASGEDGEIKLGNVIQSVNYVYDGVKKAWRKATTVEAALGGCIETREADISLNTGKVNGTWYICKSRKWEITDSITVDTQGWMSGSDGDIKKGDSTDVLYKYDQALDKWVATNAKDVNLGLMGCTTNRTGEIDKSGETYYACKNDNWQVASDIEKDTYQWAAGEDGEIKLGSVTKSVNYVYDGAENAWRNASAVETALGGCTENREADISLNTGKVNGTWYICKSRKWGITDSFTVDTQGWMGGSDGEIKKGDSTDVKYKYDKVLNQWVATNTNDVNLDLMGCTTNRNGEVGKNSGTYYICKNSNWQVAAEIDYDTYGEKCTSAEVGKTMNGVVTAANKYYCSANGWVSLMGGWTFDVPKEARLNPKITYGSMKDTRDNKTYKTVEICNKDKSECQTWMAENLNYADSTKTPSLKGKSWCYDNKAENCDVTGRLYTWAAAIDSAALANDSDNPQTCGYGKTCMLPTVVQGVCPEGWHLPSYDEWQTLFTAVGGSSKAGTALESQTGWYSQTGDAADRDAYGFSALPAGRRNDDGSFDIAGNFALFWSASEYNSSYAYFMRLNYYDENADLGYNSKIYGHSVRCLQN